MKTIFIDMDGVIVDLSQNINIWFNNHPNLKEKYKEFPIRLYTCNDSI